MIGVIVVPGNSSGMYGLDAKRSSALLPIGDRPMLQHIVESLVAQKITNIELIVDHAPESIEALLGNGDRWGGRFRYHLMSQTELPYKSLKIIPGLKMDSWVLIHAESYPVCRVATTVLSQNPVLFYEESLLETSFRRWKGTAVFPADSAIDQLSNLTSQELRNHLEAMADRSEADVIEVPGWLDVSSPSELLRSQTLLLERRLDGLMISGIESEPGIWISRNVAVHPSAVLVAPAYIGPDSRINRGVRIGPNVVIEGESIVDSGTSIENSLVAAGSYIGEALELDNTIVDHNLLINVRLGTGVNITESFLLGGLKKRRQQSWFARFSQSLLAALLFAILLPVFIPILIVYSLRGIFFTLIDMVQIPAAGDGAPATLYKLPCIGRNAWSVHGRAGWGSFSRQFVPGLLAVAQGRLGFVGLPPRTPEEVQALSAEWKELYLDNVAGLITEAALVDGDPGDRTQMYLADAYYSVRRNFLYNMKLVGKYFLRLLIPLS